MKTKSRNQSYNNNQHAMKVKNIYIETLVRLTIKFDMDYLHMGHVEVIHI